MTGWKWCMDCEHHYTSHVDALDAETACAILGCDCPQMQWQMEA